MTVERAAKRQSTRGDPPSPPRPVLPLEVWDIIIKFLRIQSDTRMSGEYDEDLEEAFWTNLHYETQRSLCRLASTCRILLNHIVPILYQKPLFHQVSKPYHCDYPNYERCIKRLLISISKNAYTFSKI